MSNAAKPVFEIAAQRRAVESQAIKQAVVGAWADSAAWQKWLASESAGCCGFLLAHADDGIFWGRFENDRLLLQPGATLVPDRLQQFRAFGAKAELFAWRSAGGPAWRRRWLRDGEGDECLAWDERQVLWGRVVEQAADGFTLISEGADGLRHWVPAEMAAKPYDRRPLRLRLRHYLQEREDGRLTVEFSRLAGVEVAAGAREEDN